MAKHVFMGQLPTGMVPVTATCRDGVTWEAEAEYEGARIWVQHSRAGLAAEAVCVVIGYLYEGLEIETWGSC